jgi:signal transduction histidine kinase
VRRVMELHGGRVELVRNGRDGATFRLLIEQSPEP